MNPQGAEGAADAAREALKDWKGVRPLDPHELVDTLWSEVTSWVDLAVRTLPNLVVAVLVVVFFFVLAGRIAPLARRALDRVSDNQQVTSLLEIVLRTAIRAVGLFAALSVLDLDGVVTSLLAGVGVVGLALGFAFQDIAANFMSGVSMAVQRPFRVGDLVESQDRLGTVTSVDLRTTTLLTPDGDHVLLPNKDVYNSVLVNHTRTPERRIVVSLGVAYADDLRVAREAVVAALEGLEVSLGDRPAEVWFTGFGESSVDFDALFWVRARTQADYRRARSEAVIAIHTALAEEGCTIPFPIRTLDFGAAAVGGEELRTLQLDRVAS
ncbi:MAG: mechanosensitive ion channel family protein [Alphaproteobacteria bacterium]|nr:mechanosensitive ion channel family protein [Alphaproteobacteria bacterium]